MITGLGIATSIDTRDNCSKIDWTTFDPLSGRHVGFEALGDYGSVRDCEGAQEKMTCPLSQPREQSREVPEAPYPNLP